MVGREVADMCVCVHVCVCRYLHIYGFAHIGRSSIERQPQARGLLYWWRGEGLVRVRVCLPVCLESVGKRIAVWRTHRNRGRTMDPFNYPRDSTRRRKQAPSRTGRCAAPRTDRVTINSANISNRTNYLGEIFPSPRDTEGRQKGGGKSRGGKKKEGWMMRL